MFEERLALEAVTGVIPRLWAVERWPKLPSFSTLNYSFDTKKHHDIWQFYYPHIAVPPLPMDSIDLRHAMAGRGEFPIYVEHSLNPTVNQRRLEAYGAKLEEAEVRGWGLVPLSPETPFKGLNAEALGERFAERDGWCITYRGYEIYGEMIRQMTGVYPDRSTLGIRLLAGSSWGKNAVVVNFQRRQGHLRFWQKIVADPGVGGRYFAPLKA